ncbi:hypothetical protein Gogos_011069 [Gossypium gossypioides]|uniref:RNase H type-1 domain-containing protein n=1 Tax=Gossypium gossypioides TaxID=34282 RepID=A0A7J9BN97_GOSGO|nr:hypothetical protein [Gossypium gossypioides]
MGVDYWLQLIFGQLFLDSELWDIFDGLKLVLDKGIDRVLIQTDSLEAVNTI